MESEKFVSAPWDYTPADIEKDEAQKQAAATYMQTRIRTPWEFNSLNSTELAEQEEQKRLAADYRFRTPWDQHSEDLRDTLEKNIAALDYTYEAPWEKVESPNEDVEQLERQLNALNYTYEPLWKVPEMSEAKKKQLAAYKYCPPFRTENNIIKEDKKPAKRMDPSRNPPTLPPWAHGSEPAEAPHAKSLFARPPTSLWTVPKEEKPAENFESSGDPILDSLRLQLRKHGAIGIHGLSRKFKIMDDDGSGQLDMAEFKKGMKELKLAELSDKAIEHLFRFFDREDSGTISYDEFLAGIRGVMNARRKALVDLAFNVLDRDGSGEVTLDDMKQAYNAKEHPEVKMKRKTENQVLLELLDGFDVGGNKDGIVTRDEFHNYYANVSGNVDSDDYFELMIRNAWHISGGEGWCQNTTNKRVLVTHADGRQTVEEIKNDMGLKANDKAGMVARLRAQGIAAAKINTNGATDESNGRGGDGSNLMQAPAMQPQQPQMPENITPYGPTGTQPRTNPYYPSGTGMNAASPRISGIHVQTANRAAYPAPQPAPPATVTAPQAQRLRTGSTVVGTAGRPQLQPQQARQTAQLQVNVGTGSYNAGQPLHSSSGSVADNATALRGTLRPKSLSVMASATAPANLEQQYLPNMYQQQQQGEGYMYANQGGGVGVPYQYSEAAGGGGVGSYSTEGQLSGRRK